MNCATFRAGVVWPSKPPSFQVGFRWWLSEEMKDPGTRRRRSRGLSWKAGGWGYPCPAAGVGCARSAGELRGAALGREFMETALGGCGFGLGSGAARGEAFGEGVGLFN